MSPLRFVRVVLQLVEGPFDVAVVLHDQIDDIGSHATSLSPGPASAGVTPRCWYPVAKPSECF